MGRTKQFGALLRMNLAAVPQRLGLVCTIVIGVACAVGVLVSSVAFLLSLGWASYRRR